MMHTGFAGFDALTGGLEGGKNYILYGNIGTGKTTFSLQFLYQGLVAGENVVLVTRRDAETVFEQGKAFGMDLQSFARDRHLIIFEYHPHVVENSMRLKEPVDIGREFEFVLAGDMIQRFAFDPMTPLLASPSPSTSVFRARTVIQALSSLGAAGLYTFDTPEGEEYLGNCKDFVYGVLRFEQGSSQASGRLVLERLPGPKGRPTQVEFEVAPGVGLVETAAVRAGQEGVQRRILIIEPDADQREALKSLLAKSYTILEAEGAADGLAKVAAESPDLLILERETKGVDGVEVVRQLRQNKMNVPVILISKQIRRAHDRVEIMAAGADECLERPVDGRILKLKVQNLLRRYEGLRDRFVSAPVEASVTTATARDTTTTTTNLAYFYDRVQQEINYASENGLRFVVLHMQVPDGGPAHQELCAVAGTLIREYDLMYTDNKRVAVLLGETDENGVKAFLNRLRERWNKPTPPSVGYKCFDRDENFLQTAKELLEATRA